MSLPLSSIDVLIVGTGPAGSSTALHLLQQDPAWAGRILMVDKAVHPREKLCGGGITHLGENVLTRLGLPFEPTNFPVREVRLVYQNESYSFRGNPAFRIVHRAQFDHWLVQQVIGRGVEVHQGETLVEVTPQETHVEVVTDKAIYHAKVLVAADGSRSRIRAKLKWDDDSRVARLIEVLTPESPHAWEFRDGVAIFDFSQMTGAGLQGYYWDFPSIVGGTLQMNRGVFDSRARPERPKADLKETLREALAKRERNLDDYTMKGHPIRWFDKNGRFSQPRILLAGDAAGADPLFGEGISFALGYGLVAAQAVQHAFASGDFSMADYRQRIIRDPLLRSLPTRVWLAKFAYLMKYPWFVRWGWRMARRIIGWTRWRDAAYVPAEQGKWVR